MSRKFFNLLFICCAIVLMAGTCAGCKHKCKNPQCTCKKCTCTNCNDSCKCMPVIDTPNICRVDKAYLYLDNSESMKGYSSDIKNYTNVLTYLTNAYSNKEVRLCGVSDNQQQTYQVLDEKDGTLIDQVRNMRYGGSSLLNKDLENMLKQVADNNICFFVTDGILSGKSEDIKKDREWTIRHAADLQMNIQKLFEGHRDVAVSVYQFRADYNGEYYDYANIHKSIHATRPYYVFVIGKPHAVLDFKSKVSENKQEFFQPVHQLHFISELPITGVATVTGAERKGGTWSFDKKRIDSDAKHPKEMCLTVKDMLFKNELNQEEISKLASKFEVKTPNGTFTDVTEYDPNNKQYEIVLSNYGAYGSKFDLEITVPYTFPDWVASSSCDNDSYMKTQPDQRTFLLSTLLKGIQQGKFGDNGYLYQTTVSLQRKQ